MSVARSTQFAAGLVGVSSTSTTVLYTVPAGFVAIVKFAAIFNAANGSVTVSLLVLNSSSNELARIYGTSIAGAGAAAVDRPDLGPGVVLSAGQKLGIQAVPTVGTTGNVRYVISGSQLSTA